MIAHVNTPAALLILLMPEFHVSMVQAHMRKARPTAAAELLPKMQASFQQLASPLIKSGYISDKFPCDIQISADFGDDEAQPNFYKWVKATVLIQATASDELQQMYDRWTLEFSIDKGMEIHHVPI